MALDSPFEELYTRNFAFVRRTLVHLGVRHADLEDALQETFVAAYRNRNRFWQGADERAWLFGIARRIAFRARRSVARRTRLAEAYQPLGSIPAVPETVLSHRRTARLLQSFLDNLEPSKRAVFVLARLEGMTGVEVARTLAINANTMGSRLRAAQRDLDRFVRLHCAKAGVASLVNDEVVQTNTRGPDGRARVWALLVAKLPVAAPWAVPFAIKPMLLTAVVLLCAGAVLGPRPRALGSEPPVTASATVRQAPIAVAPRVERRGPTADTVPTTVRPPPPAPQTPVARTPVPAAVRKQTPASRLAVETRLVQSARAELKRGQPRRALDLLRRHTQAFPHGVFADQGAALQIRALCAAGREAQAKTAARASRDTLPGLAFVAVDGCAALERSTKTPRSGE